MQAISYSRNYLEETASLPSYSDRLVQLRKARKRQSSQFSKRRNTVLRKVHELQRDCGVDVYVCVRSRQSNQMWQYSNGFTPPMATDTVRDEQRIFYAEKKLKLF